MTDWADEIAENLRDNQDELMPWKTLTAIAAALRKARQDGREDALKLAATLENLWSDEWRAGNKADQHLEGMSDGANAIWIAIRALGDKP